MTIHSPLGSLLKSDGDINVSLHRADAVAHWSNLYDATSKESAPLPNAENLAIADPTGMMKPGDRGMGPQLVERIAAICHQAQGDAMLDDALGNFWGMGVGLAKDTTATGNGTTGRAEKDKPPEAKPQNWGDVDMNRKPGGGAKPDTPNFDDVNVAGGGQAGATGTGKAGGKSAGAGANQTQDSGASTDDGTPPVQKQQDPPATWQSAVTQVRDVQPPTTKPVIPMRKDGRIIFFGYELASGDTEDRSRPAILDADHVVIVVQYPDGSTEILDRANAIPVLRAHQFIPPDSLALTASGRRGSETPYKVEGDEPPQKKPDAPLNYTLIKRVEVFRDRLTGKQFKDVQFFHYTCIKVVNPNAKTFEEAVALSPCANGAAAVQSFSDMEKNYTQYHTPGYYSAGRSICYPVECKGPEGKEIGRVGAFDADYNRTHTQELILERYSIEFVAGPFNSREASAAALRNVVCQ